MMPNREQKDGIEEFFLIDLFDSENDDIPVNDWRFTRLLVFTNKSHDKWNDYSATTLKSRPVEIFFCIDKS